VLGEVIPLFCRFEQLSHEAACLHKDIEVAMKLAEGFDVEIAAIKVV
jgi:hypothetical protein